MNFKMGSIIVMIFTLVAMNIPVFAQDYSNYSTEELAAMRGTMREASQEDREAFQKEWQNRYQKMTQEERQQYMGRPESAPADGKGYRLNTPNSSEGRGQGLGSGTGGGKGFGAGKN